VVFPDRSTADLGAPKGTSVFSYGETYAADQVMKTVITAGTGTAANYGCPAAGKTGTTTNFTDAYFDGFTPKLATAVWVGYPKATTSMPGGFGGTLAAPIWHDYMQQASAGYCGDWTSPSTPWQGTPFFGPRAATGNARVGFGTGTTYTNGAGTGTGTTTSPGQVPTTTQGATTTPTPGNGNGGGGTNTTGGAGTGAPPAGFGNGHGPSGH
jgi:penicillin-binding protein 1A